MNGKTIFIAIVALVIGFGSGFVLRPVFIPVEIAPAASQGAGLTAPAGDARSTQYFAANLDEARETVAQCAAGTVRGQECANAEIAIVEAEGKERFDAFMGR
ncbi:hypothetical protein [Sphingopyxis indica]|uniref:Uncharacterized protein n=1 Tax=Sphingopyxis indica TaxID=436663 RepID=A0A239LIS9_9SPHN|nr:hypothetical protein [Sphingopyxis indica]SNT29822.1 hypothetical protein SAMN06295955_12419 [Sphingopyxis indica]